MTIDLTSVANTFVANLPAIIAAVVSGISALAVGIHMQQPGYMNKGESLKADEP